MKQYSNTISSEEVAALLSYDPQTGRFTRKVNEVGHLNAKGYVQIRLLGYKFQAHRLAWLLTYGVWPNGVIDHINCCPSDNRIINLRDVSVAENGWNRKRAYSNNKTGTLGVHKRGDKFRAEIKSKEKRYSLGHFDTVEEAAHAYTAAKEELHMIKGLNREES